MQSEDIDLGPDFAHTAVIIINEASLNGTNPDLVPLLGAFYPRQK